MTDATKAVDATASETAAEEPEKPFDIIVRVRRYNPETDSEPYWQEFTVPMYSTSRILDALHHIKWEQDSTLAFRR